MDIQITVNCPDIIQAAQIFADALKDLRFKMNLTAAAAAEPATAAGIINAARAVVAEADANAPAADPAVSEGDQESAHSDPQESAAPAETGHDAENDKAQAEEQKESAQAYTLEQVRAELTKLPSNTARSIVTSFGVPKLTAIPPKSYPALMAKIKEAS